MDDINELVRRGRTAIIYDYTGAESELPKLLADALEAQAAELALAKADASRLKAANDMLLRNMAEKDAELTRLRQKAAQIADDYHPERGQEVLALSEMREAIAALTQPTGDRT